MDGQLYRRIALAGQVAGRAYSRQFLVYQTINLRAKVTISVLLQNRTKQKEIAKTINVSPSTVSRKIRRNSGVRRHYNRDTNLTNAV